MPDIEEIRSALSTVVDPCSIATGVPISVVDMGMIVNIDIADGGDIQITLRLTSPICWQAGNIGAKVEEKVGNIHGVGTVRCLFDAASEWMPDMMSEIARKRLRQVRPFPVVPATAATRGA